MSHKEKKNCLVILETQYRLRFQAAAIEKQEENDDNLYKLPNTDCNTSINLDRSQSQFTRSNLCLSIVMKHVLSY